MARFMDKTTVVSGQAKRNKFNFDGQTVTTTDFFRPIPIRSIPVFPNDSVSLKTEAMIRLQPLPVPTFGRVDATLRWFFVPYRAAFYAWNKFIERIPYKNTIVPSVPKVLNSHIVQVFQSLTDYEVGKSNAWVTLMYKDVTDTSLDGYDFGSTELINGTLFYLYYKFTPRGRHLYNILCSLGYSINWSLNDLSEMSLLPLLCYLRVICDYYTDPQIGQSFEEYFDLTYSLSIGDLEQLFFRVTQSNYDFDYFTSAWQSPTSPVAKVSQPSLSVQDITMTPNSVSSNNSQTIVDTNANYTSDTPVIESVSNTSGSQKTNLRNISQYAIDSLRVVSNYIRRHNLVGWRLMDRFLADFGKKLDYKVANQSIYLTSQQIPVQIGAVFSNSDTSSSGGRVLGAYAGSGIGYGDDTLKFDSDDQHGMLICISTIVPKISYYQGRCRQQGVLATTPLDFLNGDFDQLGVQSIDLQEVFADAKSPVEFDQNWHGSWSPRKVWGFTQRYQEWKTGYDILSGDFRVPTLRTGADSYHLFREIFPSGKSYDVTQGQYQYFTSITPTFRIGQQAQFDRIFSFQSTDADHFNLFANFQIEVWRNATKIGDTLLDTHSNEQNDEVTIRRDGSLFN